MCQHSLSIHERSLLDRIDALRRATSSSFPVASPGTQTSSDQLRIVLARVLEVLFPRTLRSDDTTLYVLRFEPCSVRLSLVANWLVRSHRTTPVRVCGTLGATPEDRLAASQSRIPSILRSSFFVPEAFAFHDALYPLAGITPSGLVVSLLGRSIIRGIDDGGVPPAIIHDTSSVVRLWRGKHVGPLARHWLECLEDLPPVGMLLLPIRASAFPNVREGGVVILVRDEPFSRSQSWSSAFRVRVLRQLAAIAVGRSDDSASWRPS